jgi:hypothetical protein
VVICSHCDRGNRYCGKQCAQTARRQSQREAARRYQASRRGRFAHAARQRRYRRRRSAKVAHQQFPPKKDIQALQRLRAHYEKVLRKVLLLNQYTARQT